MGKLEETLYQKIKSGMSAWDEEGIYAVSFFVYANMAFHYRDYWNVPSFAISYNTEDDCKGAGRHSEERWNYAFWLQDETPILEPEDNSAEMKLLFDWYEELGLENIGEQDELHPDPVGYPELVALIARVARRFQEEGFLKAKFGHSIPIIIHDLEYVDCIWEATSYANPNGEAADFLERKWQSIESCLPICMPISATPALARDILLDEAKLKKLLAASPCLSEEYLKDMLKQIGKL